MATTTEYHSSRFSARNSSQALERSARWQGVGGVAPKSERHPVTRSASRRVVAGANQGICLMASKQYDAAIHVFEDTLAQFHLLALDTGDAPITSPPHIVEKQRLRSLKASLSFTANKRRSPLSSVRLHFAGRNEELEKTLARPYVNDVINTDFQNAWFRLFDHAFVAPSPELYGNGKHDQHLAFSAVLVYNMGLSYHLAALSGALNTQILLETSLRLYRLSLTLIETLPEASQRCYHTTKLVLATVSNMGHIYSGFCDVESMQVCRDCMLSHYHDLISSIDFYSGPCTHPRAGTGSSDSGDYCCADLLDFFSCCVVMSPQECLVAGAAA
jgi:hypothetical protein